MKARVASIRPAGHSTTPTPTLFEWVPAGRRLVLVDIENLVGGSGTASPTFPKLSTAFAPRSGSQTTTSGRRHADQSCCQPQ